MPLAALATKELLVKAGALLAVMASRLHGFRARVGRRPVGITSRRPVQPRGGHFWPDMRLSIRTPSPASLDTGSGTDEPGYCSLGSEGNEMNVMQQNDGLGEWAFCLRSFQSL